MTLGEVRPVTSFFDIVRAHNYGAAFSFLNHADGAPALVLPRAGRGGGGLHRLDAAQACRAAPLWLALSLVLGGALGNVLDRVWHGYVVDFIQVHYAGGISPLSTWQTVPSPSAPSSRSWMRHAVSDAPEPTPEVPAVYQPYARAQCQRGPAAEPALRRRARWLAAAGLARLVARAQRQPVLWRLLLRDGAGRAAGLQACAALPSPCAPASRCSGPSCASASIR